MASRMKCAIGAAVLSTVLSGAFTSSVLAQEPYIGEIDSFAFSFCPKGWAAANGQLLAINQNQALFALLGTQFGGNGTTTFALPDLRGRVQIGAGQGAGLSDYAVGQKAGVEFGTLTQNEMPLHAHLVPDLGVPPTVQVKNSTGPAASVETTAAGGSLDSTSAGGSQPHSNIQPYTAMNACIALVGIFP